MGTYGWMARWLPRCNFATKIVLAGLVIVHVPLLLIVVVVVAYPGLSTAAVAGIAVAATVLASVALTLVLRGLLAPLQLAGEHLSRYLTDRRLPPAAIVGGDEAGQLLHDVAVSCAQIERLRQVLEQHALTDPLTGADNRRSAEARLARIGAPHGDRRRPVTVAMVDLDNLREHNTAGGHARGDIGLRRVALELQGVLRAQDWVARWGGDEFLVICHCSGADMITLLERVREQLTATRSPAESFSVSAGIAELRADESMSDCIARADTALYTAKHQGRDIVRAAS